MLLKNKKAMPGTTLGWIVVTTLIFFLLILYLVSLAAFSFNKNKPEITLNTREENKDLLLNKELSEILSTELIDNGNLMSISSLIEQGKEGSFEVEIKEILDGICLEYYFKTPNLDINTYFTSFDRNIVELTVKGGENRQVKYTKSSLC